MKGEYEKDAKKETEFTLSYLRFVIRKGTSQFLVSVEPARNPPPSRSSRKASFRNVFSHQSSSVIQPILRRPKPPIGAWQRVRQAHESHSPRSHISHRHTGKETATILYENCTKNPCSLDKFITHSAIHARTTVISRWCYHQDASHALLGIPPNPQLRTLSFPHHSHTVHCQSHAQLCKPFTFRRLCQTPSAYLQNRNESGRLLSLLAEY